MRINFKPKRIILHPGLPKTGTTTIQSALHRMKDKILSESGILYPGQEISHDLKLSTAFARDPRILIPHRVAGRQNLDELVAFGAQSLSEYEIEIEMKKPETVVFSGETLSNFLGDELSRLGQWLTRIGSEIEVLYVIRNPLSHANSVGQQVLKQGYTLSELYQSPILQNLPGRLDATIQGFGKQSIRIETYEEMSSSEGGIVGSFLDKIGMPRGDVWSETIESSSRENTSLSLASTLILDSINRQRPAFVDGNRNAKRTFTEVQFLSRITGPRFRFPPEVERKILNEAARDLAWLEAEFGIQPYPNLAENISTEVTENIFDAETTDQIGLLLSDLINDLHNLEIHYLHLLEAEKMKTAFAEMKTEEILAITEANAKRKSSRVLKHFLRRIRRRA